MADQAKNILIGLFVIAACAVVAFMLLFLHPTVGDERKVFRVRFANIDKVSIGTRVLFAGKPVGEVVSIHEIPDAINERKEINGYVYVYEVKLRVDSSVNIFNSDDISLKTAGLLGERSVAITPQAPKPNEPLVLVNDQVVYANETGTVEEAIKDFQKLSTKIERVVDDFIVTLDDVKKEKIVYKLGELLANLDEISAAINKPKLLTETVTNIHAFSDRLVHTGNSIDEIVTKVSKGEGTLGKILVENQLYFQTTAVLSKAETLFNDINHYGVLFHLDKGWQRLRARRMNLLNKLSTPQEFRNYFNDELDQLTTSLERVEMMLDQTTGSPCGLEVYGSREFAKVYAELLRRIATIEESLKMYTEQVRDIQEFQQENCYYPMQTCY